MITTAQEIKETLKRLGIQNVTVEIKDNPDAVTDYKARLKTEIQGLEPDELLYGVNMSYHQALYDVLKIVEEL